jgi:hypothetical protein
MLKQKNAAGWPDFGALAAYTVAVLVGVAHHEPWADEAEAWLIARDVPFRKMIFGEMHYEVSPGLWHAVLWVAQHVFHLPYSSMNWIGAVFAIAGATVLIIAAPFPRIVRYLIAASYYVVYQYAVIARPYVMLLLFGGIAAMNYRQRRPILLALALALLCFVSLHGAILAFAITLGAAWHAFSEWRQMNTTEQRRYVLAFAIVSTAFALMVVITYPSHDVSAFAHSFHGGDKAKLIRTLNDAGVEPWPVSVALILSLSGFALLRRELTVFVVAVGGLILFQSRVYGAPHHEGTIVVAMIVALWIAWPMTDEPRRMSTLAASTLFACMFAVQTCWALAAWRHDYTLPYSGAEDAARYLKSVGATRINTFGTNFGAVAIQAYFPSNCFGNWTAAYLHHALTTENAMERFDLRSAPEFVVVTQWEFSDEAVVALFRSQGYRLVHISPGDVFSKFGVWRRQTYLIFRRERSERQLSARDPSR